MRARGDGPIRAGKIPAPNEGARNAGCAQRIRSLVRKYKKHTSIVTTVTPPHPAFRTQWF